MGETERLTVEVISELQDKIATQYQIICSLDAMNDELQAKLEQIEKILNNGSKENGISSLNAIREVIKE